MPMMYERECYAIRGAIFEVYSVLGSGFAEEVYQEALELEMGKRGIPFVPQQRLQICYKGQVLNKFYVADMICYGKIILELKAVHAILPEHEAQLINYLKATSIELGLLVNFGTFPEVDIRTRTRRAGFVPQVFKEEH